MFFLLFYWLSWPLSPLYHRILVSIVSLLLKHGLSCFFITESWSLSPLITEYWPLSLVLASITEFWSLSPLYHRILVSLAALSPNPGLSRLFITESCSLSILYYWILVSLSPYHWIRVSLVSLSRNPGLSRLMICRIENLRQGNVI